MLPNNHTTLLSNSEILFYNYVYVDPRKPGKYTYDGLDICFLYEPFYVGKGTKYRKFRHLDEKQLKYKTYKNNKIKAIIKEYDMKSYILVCNSTISESKAFETEIHLITSIGRLDINTGPLCNQTQGGNGAFGPSPELRKKYGSPKEKHPLWGKTHTKQSKQLISKNHANVSGELNGRAKTWLICDFFGNQKIIKGNVNHILTTLKVNQGIIPNTQYKKKSTHYLGIQVFRYNTPAEIQLANNHILSQSEIIEDIIDKSFKKGRNQDQIKLLTLFYITEILKIKNLPTIIT